MTMRLLLITPINILRSFISAYGHVLLVNQFCELKTSTSPEKKRSKESCSFEDNLLFGGKRKKREDSTKSLLIGWKHCPCKYNTHCFTSLGYY